MTKPTPVHQTVWRFPSRSLAGECITVLGVGVALAGLGRLATFGAFDPSWLALISGSMFLGIGIHRLRTPFHGTFVHGDPAEVEAVSSYGYNPNAIYVDDMSAEVQRIASLLRDPKNPEKAWAMLLTDSITYSEEGGVTGYRIRATKPGYFTNKRNCTMTADRLIKGVKGDWYISFSETGDVATVTERLPFPRGLAPPLIRIPQNVDDAISMYTSSYWEFGEDARGNPIRAKLNGNYHIALIATTGGGKSVLARTLIEERRATDMVLLFDGKGSDYPRQLGYMSNIAAVAKSGPEAMVYMKWLHDEMVERFVEADKRKADGNAAEAFDFPTIFVLVDELPSLREDVGSMPGKKKDKDKFDSYMSLLLRKGREVRMHFCLISQSLKVDAIPSAWQECLAAVVFLGRVSARSLISDQIPEDIRQEVARIADGISPTTKGRGVYLHREGGAVQPIEFQSYYGWSEGTTTHSQALTPEMRKAWAQAEEAQRRIPSLYDRIGIKVDDPSWRQLDADELESVETILLTDENGPIKEREIYDPLSPHFKGGIGKVVDGRARGRGSVAKARP